MPDAGAGLGAIERLRVVRARVVLTYRLPNPRMRRRNGRLVPYEDVAVERELTVNISTDALDPLTGLTSLCQQLARGVYRQLRQQGWPVQQEEVTSDRP